MSRRTAGISLIVVSTLLYAARYIAAAIFGSGVSSWSQELFQAMLINVGKGSVTWSIIALVSGVAYLLWAEFDELRRARRKQMEEDV